MATLLLNGPAGENRSSELSAKVGEEIAVTVTDNVTTGYRWEIEELPVGLTVSGQDMDSFEPAIPLDEQEELELVGVGGELTFRFVASKPLAGELVLVRRRPWMRGKEDETMIVYTIDLTVEA